MHRQGCHVDVLVVVSVELGSNSLDLSKTTDRASVGDDHQLDSLI